MNAAAYAAQQVDLHLARAKHAGDVEQDMRAESEHLATARYWMKIWGSHYATK